VTLTSTPPLVHPSGPRALPNMTRGGILRHMRLMHLLYPSNMAQTLCKRGCKAQSPNMGLPHHRPTHCKLLSTTRRSADISTIGWTFRLWGGHFDCRVDVSAVGQMFRLWGGRFDCGADVSTAGCVYRHWDGRFYCIPTLYLDSLLYC